MAPSTRQAERRDDALSRRRIVDAAVELLDESGEAGLTFRALSTRLSTGPGAIYWHVAGKGELLAAAAETVLAGATAVADEAPEDAVRRVALGVYDAIEAHPWVGDRLAGPASSQPAMLQIFDLLGRQVLRLGLAGGELFAAASALLNYVLGMGMQEAANNRFATPDVSREEFLAAEARAWQDLDQATYPFLHEIAGLFPEHDDREQYLAGVDLILAGIRASAGRTDPAAG